MSELPATLPFVPTPSLGKRDFDLLRELIAKHCGIKINNSKRLLLQNRVGRRVKALGLSSFHEYHRRLTRGNDAERGQELSRLWSVVTTNETHFFREPHHFDTLREVLLPRLTTARSVNRPLRLWSAGCSTGQEAYTLAMVVHHWSRERYRFSVLGSDLDEEALRLAQTGTYPVAARSEIPPIYAAKYVELQGDQVHVSSEVRRVTRFVAHNFANVEPQRPRLDVIFCRNAMMYLNADTRARLVEVFYQSLVDGGCFVVGTAESAVYNSRHFARARFGRSTVLFKRRSVE